ncbi:hypothetical protein FA95DRAFT_1575963 [Auriscalpium vulgare]|uniref:Uncharacterized protein n=1 Tax=Auriscalpium vulgare TaxID=40419 RepID=A0ACB8RDD9_9AGAM|nr:hypothetical protein FA95DRAFT_1575963 [Auriscalpium vulgare]
MQDSGASPEDYGWQYAGSATDAFPVDYGVDVLPKVHYNHDQVPSALAHFDSTSVEGGATRTSSAMSRRWVQEDLGDADLADPSRIGMISRQSEYLPSLLPTPIQPDQACASQLCAEVQIPEGGYNYMDDVSVWCRRTSLATTVVEQPQNDGVSSCGAADFTERPGPCPSDVSEGAQERSER